MECDSVTASIGSSMQIWGDTASRRAFCKMWAFLRGRGRREQPYLSLCASISSRCNADHSGHPAAHRGTQTDEGHSCSSIAATCCPHTRSWVGLPAHTEPRTRVGRAAEAHHCPLRHLCREGWSHSKGTASGAAAAAQQSLHELCAQPAPLGPAMTGGTMLGHCSDLLSCSAELQLPQHSPSYI